MSDKRVNRVPLLRETVRRGQCYTEMGALAGSQATHLPIPLSGPQSVYLSNGMTGGLS